MHRSDQFPRFYITVLKTVSISSFQNFTTTFRLSYQQDMAPRIRCFRLFYCFSPNYVDFFHVGDFQENWIKGKWTLRPHPSSYSETFWTLRPEIRSGNHDNLVPLSLFFSSFFVERDLYTGRNNFKKFVSWKRKKRIKRETWFCGIVCVKSSQPIWQIESVVLINFVKFYFRSSIFHTQHFLMV